MHQKPGLFRELKRRRVFRAAALYAIVAFIVAQVADLVLPGLLLPDWTFRLIVLLLLLGFPVALVLAWSFDITPDGVRRADRPETSPGSAPDSGGAGPGPGAGRGPGSVETAEPAVRFGSSRAAGLVGLGILIALIGFGGYHFVGAPSRHGDAPAAADARHTIAVLPFTNMAGGQENEYFADGITEDILTNLGLVPDFTVISRTSVMRYKGSNMSIPEIADQLGVRYVLEGSVRRAGDRVRVVVQLIEPGTDTQVWAQTLDRRIEDIFALQSEIAHSVVDALRVQLAGGVGERIRRAPTEDIAAYELFLHGREAYYQYSAPAMERAIDLFRQAIEQDPQFALAHAWLGSAYAVSVFNYGADPDLVEAAVESARRAIALQPDLGDAHRALGTAMAVGGRFAEAIPALERAVELNPNDFAAVANLGLTYALRGKWDLAIDAARRSIQHDPVRSYLAYGNLATFYRQLGLLDRTLDAANRALTLRPNDRIGRMNLAWVDLFRGRTTEAVTRVEAVAGDYADPTTLGDVAFFLLLADEEEGARVLFERLHAAVPDALPVNGHAPAVTLAHLLFRRSEPGDAERARQLLAESERLTRLAIEAGNGGAALPYSLAGVSALLGRTEEALDHLEQAVERGWNAPWVTARDPVLASLRNEPRFLATVDRMRERTDVMRARVEREGW